MTRLTIPTSLPDTYGPTHASFLRVLSTTNRGTCEANFSFICRSDAVEIEWRYTTDLYPPPRAARDFRSREDLNEQVWNYSFKDDTAG